MTRESRLAFAERSFLTNTGLNAELATHEVPNTEIIACAHYGLAFIARLREDNTIAARHLLKMFEIDPRLARTALAPKLYDEVFLTRCDDIISESMDAMEAVADPGTPCEPAENMGDHVNNLIVWVSGRDHTMWTQEDFDETIAKLEEERESQIDIRCSEVATELLAES